MLNTNMPNVYINDILENTPVVEDSAVYRGMMLGVTRSGPLNESVLVTSWTEFVEKFAYGLDTPFMDNSELPQAVYGFFLNGGSELYVGRVASTKAKKATNSDKDIKVVANYEGTWANSIEVSLAKDGDDAFSLILKSGGSVIAQVDELTDSNFIESCSNNYTLSKLVSIELGETFANLEAKVGSLGTLAGGDDGLDTAPSEDLGLQGGKFGDDTFINGLKIFDNDVDNAIFIAIPGQTSDSVLKGLTSYAEEKQLHPILATPVNASIDDVVALRKKLSCKYGEIVYPRGVVNDTVSGGTKVVSLEGYIMGMYCSVINGQGIHKVPAGTSAVVKGCIGLEKSLSDDDVGVLNKAKVISIISKKNLGIVVWGARSLNDEDGKMRYISDCVINLVIKKELYAQTLFAVFEPNTDTLRANIKGICSTLLESYRSQGVLKGTTKDEAYQVICDSSNNSDESIDNGVLNISVAYAPNKPTEFIYINLSHAYSGSSNE